MTINLDLNYQKQRTLKTLHIGNVANYAYNIAKCLQFSSLHSDAIGWDYYHINAQPVWEEAEFDPANIGDHFFPKLPSPQETGFIMPQWYLQGPRALACLALIAKNEGKTRRARMLRNLCDRYIIALADPAFRSSRRDVRYARIAEAIGMELVGGFGRRNLIGLVWRAVGRALLPATGNVLGPGVKSGRYILGGIKRTIFSILARLRRAKWPVLNAIDRMKSQLKSGLHPVWVACGRPGDALRQKLNSAGQNNSQQETAHRTLPAAETLLPVAMEAPSSPPPPRQAMQPEAFEDRVVRLIAQYKELYPDRAFDPMLLRQYASTIPLMERLFSSYDLIIGYAIEGIWPLMVGKPYIAYEFGTIRNLPFEDSSSGRLAALVYRNCEQIIVTNSDNEKPAKALQRPYFFLPHVINEQSGFSAEGGIQLRNELIARHGGDFFVFHPARQHWSAERDTNWDKGNDHLFRGFADLVHSNAPNARCIAVAWGATLQDSKDLVASLGISDNVIWIMPQTHTAMMKYIAASDVVADQFTIPTFGGIPPKAFFLGKPVVTSFDETLHTWCFPEMPPLIPANTAQAVSAALLRIHSDKAYAHDLSERGKIWYEKYNANARVRDVLLENLSR